jgi:hypothetical protein
MTKSILRRAATILAAKGGLVTDITVGDCLELEELQAEGMRRTNRGTGLYAAPHSMGALGADTPSTLRAFATQGQLSPEQMLDRYGIECAAVRQLLNEYLLERAPALDHTTLRGLAATLGRLFWRDLEIHQPGICSLNLAPDVAAAWKQRVLLKITRLKDPGGQVVQTHHLRSNGRAELGQVRAFYLDIAQWAMEEPARWGPWAAPSPVRREDLARVKEIRRRKSRMDQRTRERLPALPALVARVHGQAQASVERLAAGEAAAPGEEFTCRGEVLHRPPARSGPTAKTWSEDPVTGDRRDLSGEEDRAFWTWAAIETLRHAGIRIEELCELSHHSLVHYTPPTSTELIPLLQIAPSKTDTERLLVISPELADVLAAVIGRIREPSGAVAAVASYDSHERVWNPPLPLLFQRRFGGGNRSIPSGTIRDWICQAIPDTAPAEGSLRNSEGQPLRFTPHDFRRIFITDAVLHGMPPHIAQLVAGHRDINTTMGYKAVYPEEAINGHRAFIARRRALRPTEEYRAPTDAEWEKFLGHFERRKVALGTCGRSYATACIHEHSCLRCPLLRPDPAQRQRLIDIRHNLLARIDEARRKGWLGEVEGLQMPHRSPRQTRPTRSDGGAHPEETHRSRYPRPSALLKINKSSENKGGFGFHPIGVWCDNTTELLAITLRPGNAGSNHAGDHIEVLTRAIAQLPAAYRRRLLVRADGAGATHELLDWLTGPAQVRGRRLEYSVGFPTKNTALTGAITAVPEWAWTPALDADGEIRDGADVAEVTGLLDLRRWPDGMRVILRRERPHPGAQLSLLEEADGFRYQAFATNTATGQLGFLETRHRAHARVEDRIKQAKDTGLGRFPSREYAINQAWLQIVAVAADLTAWLRLLALTGELAVAEPKLLRFRMLHVPARITHSGRRRRLRLPRRWPWAAVIVEAFRRIMIIPAPT